MNGQCSYWISARDQITKQMVVWEKQLGELGLGSALKPDEEQKIEEKWGVILPQILTMSAVTRRASEKTWLTASNAKKIRVGSELKAMVRSLRITPPLVRTSIRKSSGYRPSWATPSSECTATLEGTEKDGTDLHSKTVRPSEGVRLFTHLWRGYATRDTASPTGRCEVDGHSA